MLLGINGYLSWARSKLPASVVATVFVLSSCNNLSEEQTEVATVSKEQHLDALESLDSTLGSFVDSVGCVDYSTLRENSFHLRRFLDFVKKVSPENRPDLFKNSDDRKAYWINAYNALVIQAVVDNPGIMSVKDISWGKGIFWREKFLVGGKRISLNHIEREILLNEFRDPRIHFAINCGSNSCPPLGNRVLTGKDLDAQLEDKAARFIQDTNHVRIDRQRQEVWLSRIFKWYKKDFAPSDESLLEFVTGYLPDLSGEMRMQIVQNYDIKYAQWDWSLNKSLVNM